MVLIAITSTGCAQPAFPSTWSKFDLIIHKTHAMFMCPHP